MTILFLGMAFLPILIRVAIKLRLGIPMLYAVLALTVFHSWYQAHTSLADGIFFALVGLAALSWVVTAARKIYDVIDGWRSDWAMAELLAHRVWQARANGDTAVNTDGLWI